MSKALLCLLLAACTADTGELQQAGFLSGTCAVSGAHPGDEIDDRAAIQAALDTQGCAELAPGVYRIDLVRDPAHYYDLIRLSDGRSLRGSGPSTVLQFTGAAGHSDIHGIGITGTGASLSDLTLDTSALTDTEEQTHAVQISGPASAISLHDVWFNHPERAQPGGDCVKVVGYENGQLVRSVAIRGNHFLQCDRGAVSSIGGFRGLVIDGNIFSDTGDQDIDIEGSSPSSGLTISGNIFLLGTHPQGGYAISIQGSNFADDVSISGNVLSGRGAFIFNARRLTVSGNTIRHTSGTTPTLYVAKESDTLTISNNVITRAASAQANGGCLVTLMHHNSGRPGASTISGNVLRQEGKYACGVDLTNVRNAVVQGNSFVWQPATPQDSAQVHLFVHAVSGMRTEVATVVGNTFESPTASPIWANVLLAGESSGASVGRVTLLGNTAIGSVSGFYCGDNVGALVSAGNNWPAATINVCPTSGGI